MVTEIMKRGELAPDFVPKDRDLAEAVAIVLSLARGGGKEQSKTSFPVAMWAEDRECLEALSHPAVAFTDVRPENLKSFCLEHIDEFRKPGGILLIVCESFRQCACDSFRDERLILVVV